MTTTRPSDRLLLIGPRNSSALINLPFARLRYASTRLICVKASLAHPLVARSGARDCLLSESIVFALSHRATSKPPRCYCRCRCRVQSKQHRFATWPRESRLHKQCRYETLLIRLSQVAVCLGCSPISRARLPAGSPLFASAPVAPARTNERKKRPNRRDLSSGAGPPNVNCAPASCESVQKSSAAAPVA